MEEKPGRREFLSCSLAVAGSAFLGKIFAEEDSDKRLSIQERRDFLEKLRWYAEWDCCDNAYETFPGKSEFDISLPSMDMVRTGDESVYDLIEFNLRNDSDERFDSCRVFIHGDIEDDSGRWFLVNSGRFPERQNLIDFHDYPADIAPGEVLTSRLYFAGLNKLDFVGLNRVEFKAYFELEQGDENKEFMLGDFAVYNKR